jgi:CO/xanthine dehydrogenase FAD-binding subunit
MQEFDFYSPRTLDELCRTLAETGGRLIAGGTDVIPQMRDGRFSVERLIDLSRLDELRFVEGRGGAVHVGALTTYAQMLASPLLQSEAPALVEAAASVGSPQTRNRGTLGGNIANASPAGDSLPPLLTLDAEVTLVSVRGKRRVPLVELLLGPGQTAIAPDEVIRHVSFARPPAKSKAAFLKLGNRHGMAVSVVSAAVLLQLGRGRHVKEVRIALGAVAPTAMRCPQTEAQLKDQPLGDDLIEWAADAASQECSPIDDVRATAAYRRYAVAHLVRRGLWATANMAQ